GRGSGVAGMTGRALRSVLGGGTLGLRHALVGLTDEAGLAVRVGGALLALPVDANLVVRLALLVRVALRIGGRTSGEKGETQDSQRQHSETTGHAHSSVGGQWLRAARSLSPAVPSCCDASQK